MTQRMSLVERRRSVLKIMREMHKTAKNQDEFTPKKAAQNAGISVVWLYHLVGKEFRKLRSQLEGPRRPIETVISRLKAQIKALKKEVRELKAKLKAVAVEQIAEAIRMIELLDSENRMLRAEIKMLRQRLDESDVIQISPYKPAE
jgi:regulator of replication initiation timing